MENKVKLEDWIKMIGEKPIFAKPETEILDGEKIRIFEMHDTNKGIKTRCYYLIENLKVVKVLLEDEKLLFAWYGSNRWKGVFESSAESEHILLSFEALKEEYDNIYNNMVERINIEIELTKRDSEKLTHELRRRNEKLEEVLLEFLLYDYLSPSI